MNGIPCELISWRTFHRLTRRLSQTIRDSGFQPELIVAIGRGGYAPARLLSDMLHQSNLTSFKVEHYTATRKQSETRIRYPLSADPGRQHILLVDDVNDTGDTYHAALRHLHNRGASGEIRTAALHEKRNSLFHTDFHAKEVRRWRWIIYPWATHEDLTALIRQLPSPTDDLQTLRDHLHRHHGIRPSISLLKEILSMMPPDM